jgi:hypothetical protein
MYQDQVENPSLWKYYTFKKIISTYKPSHLIVIGDSS